jgi:alginate O-acetyltransferase complex protein AlgI
MSLVHVLILLALSLILRSLSNPSLRKWMLLFASVFLIYWLQPLTPIRYLDFWLPTFTILLIFIIWLFTADHQSYFSHENILAAAIMTVLILLVCFTRYFAPTGIITASRPPQISQVLLVLAIFFILASILIILWRGKRIYLSAGTAIILGSFLLIKSPFLGFRVSQGLRSLMDQSTLTAAAADLRWLGFSYVAFRLLHVIRDVQKGRLKAVSLQQFTNYVIFFPSFVAGPIDRLEHFSAELAQDANSMTADLLEGGKRITIGLFKKFALADTLALIALNPVNAGQLTSSVWAWVQLYAYAFQIYLDFSGYTDIAIGLGRIIGVRLPENFDHPYLKENITTFWNSWHITLTQWFRSYFFNPVTRALRKARKPIPAYLVILTTQFSTMLLIGMWHGITWNFALWGAWHGIGLFLHNRWVEWTRPFFARHSFKPGLQKTLSATSIFFTFNFVAIGWLWFLLPAPAVSWQVFLTLFGIR